MNSATRNVTDADIAAYEQDGVVCLRRVFDMAWIETLRAATDDAMRRPGPNAETYGDADPPSFFGDLDLWTRNERFRSYVLDSPAAEIAAAIMRSSKSAFFYDQLLVKDIGSQDKTPWHQDQPYWAVKGRQVCSIWTPLDPVSEGSSLEYVHGSHNWPEFNPQHFSDHSPYAETGLPALPDIEAERSTHDIARYPLHPGDCLVFQAMIVHGAPGNTSAQHRRRAYSTRWLGDDAYYCERPGEVAIPTFATGFEDGDKFTGEMFPTVWPRSSAPNS